MHRGRLEGPDGATDMEKEETRWVTRAMETGKSVMIPRPLVWKMKGVRTQPLTQHVRGDETTGRKVTCSAGPWSSGVCTTPRQRCPKGRGDSEA